MREKTDERGREGGCGVKGNAFCELTFVAGPNISDGFLFPIPSPSLDVSRSSLILRAGSSSWIRHGSSVMGSDDDKREKRSGTVLRFVFSVPGIAN